MIEIKPTAQPLTEPAPPQGNPKPPSSGKTDLDALLSELNVPKQNFYKDNPAAATGEASANPDYYGLVPEPVPFDPEAAKRAGQRAAALTDGILSFGAATIAKSTDTEPYSASEGERNDLAAAWEGVAEKYSFEINPWFQVSFLTLTTYAPKYMAALQDRRFSIMQSQIDELKAQHRQLVADIDEKRKGLQNEPVE